MNDVEKWHSIIDAVIPHPTRPQILVRQEADRWRLPQTQFDQIWIEPIGAINHEIQRRFGLKTTVLRTINELWDETQHLIYRTYLLENHREIENPSEIENLHENSSADGTLPAGMRWIGGAELDELTFTHPEQRPALEAHLGEIEAATTSLLRAPWAKPGWQRDAETWICAQLAQLGDPVTGPIEQIKHWFLSCILCAPTACGQVYFKATNPSPLMVNEAVVTQALAQLFPRFMPKPLAIDSARQWMLLADFGKEVGWDAPVEIRAAALRDLARLQIESADKLDELLAMGCIDRRLTKLAEQIDPLLNDAKIMAYIEPEKQQKLLASASHLKALCAQLDQYSVPATLIHGDMHMGNVARQDATVSAVANPKVERYLFFDWSDACLAHPFLDVIDILHERDAAAQALLRDSYLAMWTAYEPMERLLAMWQIAYPLCALHQAVSYQYILLNTETTAGKHEFGWAMPFWFGKLVAALDALPVR